MEERNGLCSQCFPLVLPQPPLFSQKFRKPWLSTGGNRVRIFTYLDDGAGAEGTLTAARASSKIVREDIVASGYVAHPEKCCWEPSQEGDLLGFSLNLKEGSIWVPTHRIEGLKDRL